MPTGITETGFVARTRDEILTSFRNAVKEKKVFGEFIALGPEEPIGALIEVIGDEIFQVEQAAERQYYQSILDTAEGANLDRLGAIKGTPRELSKLATVTLTFTGLAHTVIPFGTRISTTDDIIFTTQGSVEIPTGDEGVEVAALCTQRGVVGNVAAGRINTVISAFSAGTDVEVENKTSAVGGGEIQTDLEYKELLRIRPNTFSAVVSGITRRFNENPTLTRVAVFHNPNNYTDEHGVPAHHVLVVVAGVGGEAISELLVNTVASGIGTFGQESRQVTFNNVQYTVNWSNPIQTDYDLLVFLDTDDGYNELLQRVAIRQKLIDYIGGRYADPSDSTRDITPIGVPIGAIIKIWEIQSQLQNITGINNCKIFIKEREDDLTLTDSITTDDNIPRTIEEWTSNASLASIMAKDNSIFTFGAAQNDNIQLERTKFPFVDFSRVFLFDGKENARPYVNYVAP